MCHHSAARPLWPRCDQLVSNRPRIVSPPCFAAHRFGVPDVIWLAVTRTYNSRDPEPRPFGTGMTHAYAIFQFWEKADLILPDGGKIHYVRISQQDLPWYQTVFEHPASPTAFYKSRIAWNGNGWDLTLKDGTVYVFGHGAPLQAIRDRHGNTVRFTWSTTNLFGAGTGNLVRYSLSVERFDDKPGEQWSSAADLNPMVRRKPFRLLSSTLRVLGDELTPLVSIMGWRGEVERHAQHHFDAR